MNIKTISYQRVKNLGNYESERIEMTIELDDDENVEDAIATLKETVKKALNISEPIDCPPF
jgi:small-conductance mechanosensitive channel